MKGKATEKCIVCLKKAKVFTGHVIDEKGKPIIAGWCSDHEGAPQINMMKRTGCYGAWHKRYGIRNDF